VRRARRARARHTLPRLRRGIDLRNPANVKSLLRRVGVEVDDTRAWRLERLRDQHPVVEALLEWRRAERIATTFGYRWLDEHVHVPTVVCAARGPVRTALRGG
jgi:DNA polymerase I